MIDAVLQALVNGVIAGALLAIPALGFSAIFAVVCRFAGMAFFAVVGGDLEMHDLPHIALPSGPERAP